MNLLHALALPALFAASLGIAAPPPPDPIGPLFRRQLELCPQEKIHLTTDRPHYMAGDTLWLRAWLVDAATHLPAPGSNFVYADLLDPEDRLVQRIKIARDRALFKGYLPLPDTLPAGDYRLCAYTRRMHGERPDYLFHKRLPIASLAAARHRVECRTTADAKEGSLRVELRFRTLDGTQRLVPEQLRLFDERQRPHLLRPADDGRFVATLKRRPARDLLHIRYTLGGQSVSRYLPLPPAERDFGVAFFPEGGALPGNTLARIGFKVLATDGLGEPITGAVLNGQNDTVARFASSPTGMGAFALFCDPSTRYRALCRNERGQLRTFDLPRPTPGACALAVYRRGDAYWIALNRDRSTTGREPFRLTVQCRGRLLYSAPWNDDRGPESRLRLPAEGLPTGVVQFLLTDSLGLPRSERLVFHVNRDEQTAVTLRADPEACDPRQAVELTVEASDPHGAPLNASLAVAVTDPRTVDADTTDHILSTLLLTSELRGHIERPARYFPQGEAVRETELDALMLTQGWSRYDVARLLRGDLETATGEPETAQSIEGSLYDSATGHRPAAGGRVLLLARESGNYLESETDERGLFRFDSIFFADNTTFVLHGSAPKRHEVRLEVAPDPPMPTSTPYPAAASHAADEPDEPGAAAERLLRLEEDEIARRYVIEEIAVSASRPERKPRFAAPSRFSSAFNSPTPGKELVEKYRPTSALDMLRYLTGVRLYRDGPTVYPYIPGEDNWYKMPPAPAYLLLDDLPVEAGELGGLTPEYIDRIEVVRGGRLSAIGNRASAGAILIYTNMDPSCDTPDAPLPHIVTVAPLGYQVVKEFYAPQYPLRAPSEEARRDYRRTLHWAPDLHTGPGRPATVRFHASDRPGPYRVTVEGLTEEGRLIYRSALICDR